MHLQLLGRGRKLLSALRARASSRLPRPAPPPSQAAHAAQGDLRSVVQDAARMAEAGMRGAAWSARLVVGTATGLGMPSGGTGEQKGACRCPPAALAVVPRPSLLVMRQAASWGREF